MVSVRHSDVRGADQYEVLGPGVWDDQCIPGRNLCRIVFDEVPERNCTFTLRARRGTLAGPPSEPFCVPGGDPG